MAQGRLSIPARVPSREPETISDCRGWQLDEPSWQNLDLARPDVPMILPVIPIDHLALSFEPWRWPFAEARRAEIDAHFAARRAERPHMWNGRV